MELTGVALVGLLDSWGFSTGSSTSDLLTISPAPTLCRVLLAVITGAIVVVLCVTVVVIVVVVVTHVVVVVIVTGVISIGDDQNHQEFLFNLSGVSFCSCLL